MILLSSHFFNKVGQKSQKPIPALQAAPFPDGFCIADPPGWKNRKREEEREKKEEMIFNRRSQPDGPNELSPTRRQKGWSVGDSKRSAQGENRVCGQITWRIGIHQ